MGLLILSLQPTYPLHSYPSHSKLNNFALKFCSHLHYHYNSLTYSNSARAAPIFTIPSNVDVSTSTTSSITGNSFLASPYSFLSLAYQLMLSRWEFIFLRYNSAGGGWTEFAKNVSGEWDGFGADFTKEGQPIELPESVVPEAYREWEVKVFDWQTQCPTLAQPHEVSLMYRTIKLLPTVGCEADAATRYSIHERNVTNNEQSPALAFAYQSSGCYVAVWPVADQGAYKLLELEHCLMNPLDKESRVRIIQVIRFEDSKLELHNIKVFVEQWYGPFRNGDQLGGCSLRDSAFAATQPLKPSQVTGVWQGLNAVATFYNSQNIILQLRDESVRQTVRDERSLILLPKQLWCSLEKGENEETCCEVGWLLDEGCTITSKCIFSSRAELKEIAIASEGLAR